MWDTTTEVTVYQLITADKFDVTSIIQDYIYTLTMTRIKLIGVDNHVLM